MLLKSAEPFYFPGGNIGCLLVHGFTGTPKEMRYLGKNLANRGYSVLGVRLVGHATRMEDMTRTSYRDWLASVEDGWWMLSGCSEKIFVIGRSAVNERGAAVLAPNAVEGDDQHDENHHLPKDP